MLTDPNLIARQAITRVPNPRLGSIAMQNVFPRLPDCPGSIEHIGPALGEHT